MRKNQICEKCGRGMGSQHERHKIVCDRLPAPNQLAYMFDTDPYLTTMRAAKKFGVNHPVVVRHMAATWWNQERLAARGTAVEFELWPKRTTPCARCFALCYPGELNPADPICNMCRDEIADDLAELSECPGKKLRRWDLEYIAKIRSMSHESDHTMPEV